MVLSRGPLPQIWPYWGSKSPPKQGILAQIWSIFGPFLVQCWSIFVRSASFQACRRRRACPRRRARCRRRVVTMFSPCRSPLFQRSSFMNAGCQCSANLKMGEQHKSRPPAFNALQISKWGSREPESTKRSFRTAAGEVIIHSHTHIHAFCEK